MLRFVVMCSLVATVVACAAPSAPRAGTGCTPVMLHDRTSGRTRVVADGVKWRARFGAGLSGLFLAEGRLWFSACSPGPQGTPSVYSADLAAPRPRLWRKGTSLIGFGADGRRFGDLHTGDAWMPKGTVASAPPAGSSSRSRGPRPWPSPRAAS